MPSDGGRPSGTPPAARRGGWSVHTRKQDPLAAQGTESGFEQGSPVTKVPAFLLTSYRPFPTQKSSGNPVIPSWSVIPSLLSLFPSPEHLEVNCTHSKLICLSICMDVERGRALLWESLAARAAAPAEQPGRPSVCVWPCQQPRGLGLPAPPRWEQGSSKACALILADMCLTSQSL